MADNKKDEDKHGGIDANDLLKLLAKFQHLELHDFEMSASNLEFRVEPGVAAPMMPNVKLPISMPTKPAALMQQTFTPPIEKYSGEIATVKLGATKSEGGTRGRSITIGGEKAPAFYTFESSIINKPVVTMDVFDMAVPLSKAVKMHVKEVLDDPAAWAKLAVEKFGADMITVHLISIDPLLKDATPKSTLKTIENVLQAVDVPLVIGGCGDPEKDTALFEEVTQAFPGERFLLSSFTRDMKIEKISKLAKQNNHAVLAFTSMDLNMARELNRNLYDYLGKDDIVMDLSTAALGYGLDYAFTNMERGRLAGLMGDGELAHPMSSGTTNAWAAREAWLKLEDRWEPRELRGPLWEVNTTLTLLLAGVDMFMMIHPAAVKTLKDVINNLSSGKKADPSKYLDWVSAKM
ncbi:MAG: CO dehydrogenase/acetyl-CoA synthase subunit delta [Candidatus Bathyarchaeota archaeon]|nr:CO dehydrogenase/acetyl-CoA synthase subunit delta [Candidatus Bathyarchaeota archaeon]